MTSQHLRVTDFIAFGVIVAIAAAIGAAFPPGAWYDALPKPPRTPPDWAFPVAWTLLYVLIAIAGAVVWRKAGNTKARIFWFAQIVLNAAWTVVMFGLQNIALAAFIAVALLISILAFMLASRNRLATALFVPYALWVGFATALNLEIWRLNGFPMQTASTQPSYFTVATAICDCFAAPATSSTTR